MNAFATAAATLHAEPNVSKAAIYTPPGPMPTPIACRIVLSERDEMGEIGAIARETVASVRLAEIPAPAEGATLAIGATTWRVRSVARDIEGVTATLALRSA